MQQSYKNPKHRPAGNTPVKQLLLSSPTWRHFAHRIHGIHATDVALEDACRLAKSMQPGVCHVACYVKTAHRCREGA